MVGKMRKYGRVLDSCSSSNILVERIKDKNPFLKRILVVDNNPNLQLTFKIAMQGDDDEPVAKQDLNPKLSWIFYKKASYDRIFD